MKIEMPSFHPFREQLWNFHPCSEGLSNHWANESPGLSLMKWRLKVMGCNSWPDSQSEWWDSHKPWLHSPNAFVFLKKNSKFYMTSFTNFYKILEFFSLSRCINHFFVIFNVLLFSTLQHFIFKKLRSKFLIIIYCWTWPMATVYMSNSNGGIVLQNLDEVSLKCVFFSYIVSKFDL